MSPADAKEYIFGFISTLKLTEKEISRLAEEADKWKNRADLARSRGADDLLSAAIMELENVYTKLAALKEEESSLKNQIDFMRRQLPGLSARERSIDVDLLEQELLMALGRTGEEAETERSFQKLEKESSADAALQALKAKLGS